MTYKEFNKQFNQEIKKLEIEHPEWIGTNNPEFMDKVSNDYIIKHLEKIIKNVNEI